MITEQVKQLRDCADMAEISEDVSMKMCAKAMKRAADTIEQLAAKARPKTGHWIEGKWTDDDVRYNDRSFKCSKCGRISHAMYDFCNCGTKMVAPQEQLRQKRKREQLMVYHQDMSDAEFEKWVYSKGICNVNIDDDIRLRVARDLIDDALTEGEEWFDIPADEMTFEQAIRAVKDLRKKVMSLIIA